MRNIVKRDGRVVPFEERKITDAIMKAVKAVGGNDSIEAERITAEVMSMLDESGTAEPTVDFIQDLVESALIKTGHTTTAKEYILYRANRDKVRSMNSHLMHTIDDLTFGKSEDIEKKRENANIDGDTSMGTMLRYGSEVAKRFNLDNLVSDDIAKAHQSGDIHIHDLDFMSLTETCIVGNSKLVIKESIHGTPKEVCANYLDKWLNNVGVDTPVSVGNLYVWTHQGFKKVKNCVKHHSTGKRVLRIHSKAATVEVTDEHRVAIKSGDTIKDVYARDIEIGMSFVDCMYNSDDIQYGVYPADNFIIDSIDEIVYTGLVYDIETTNHYFMTNGVLVHNCCQIDLEKLFKDGFNTGHGFLREPSEIRSYAALACIAIQGNQNEMHGGQSIPAFDHYMAPGVAKTFIKELYNVLDIRYPEFTKHAIDGKLSNDGIREELRNYIKKHRLILDDQDFIKGLIANKYSLKLEDREIDLCIKKAIKRTEDATYQAMEAVIHNLNSMHSRAGAQVPFSSLNFGTDTSYEGRMVIKYILKATEDGLGNGETPIFPISIMKLKEGINYNPGDPNYDLFRYSMQVSAKRLFPNYTFIDAPFNLQYYKPGDIRTEVATMGCRTRVIGNVADPENEIVTGRGNLSFTSINLPRLAIQASDGKVGNGDIDKFFSLLDEKMELVHRQLQERFKIQCLRHPRNYPFLMGQGIWFGSDSLGKDDDITEVLRKGGTQTVGFIGLAETLKMLTGKHHGESSESQELGLKIIGHMRNLTDKWSKAEGMTYGIIGTPAEGLSGRFVKIDQKKYGKIEGVTDRDYYTNSSHVPVYYPISAFKKIQIEAPYHELENAGHICYVELDGDPSKNIDAFEAVIRCMHDFGIGYGAINHPVDRDPVCGYVGIIDDVCPRCGRRDGEAMTDDMWYEIKRKSSIHSIDNCGCCGDRAEELDRIVNKI